jgi:hypothetical protein
VFPPLAICADSKATSHFSGFSREAAAAAVF